MGQLLTGRFFWQRYGRFFLYLVPPLFIDTLHKYVPNRNGTTVLGEVVFGAVDPKRPRSILELRSVLGVEEDEVLNLERLRGLDVGRRRKSALRKKRTAVADDEGPRDMG